MKPTIESLQNEVNELKQVIALFVRTSDYHFIRPIRGGTDGLRIGMLPTEKLGLFGVAPIAQWNSGTGRQDIVAGSGAAMKVDDKFDGNVGATYYGFGDVVASMKGYGFLKL